jgi:hypothetical protein
MYISTKDNGIVIDLSEAYINNGEIVYYEPKKKYVKTIKNNHFKQNNKKM